MEVIKEISLFSETNLETEILKALKDVSQEGVSTEEIACNLSRNLISCPDLVKHLYDNFEYLNCEFIEGVIESSIKKWLKDKNVYNDLITILTKLMLPKIQNVKQQSMTTQKRSEDYQKALNFCKSMSEILERLLPGRMYNKSERGRFNHKDDIVNFRNKLHQLDQMFNAGKSNYEREQEYNMFLLKQKYGERLGESRKAKS